MTQANKKPGLNEGSAGIEFVPGLFSELFNVAASRPAQMTTNQTKLMAGAAFVKPSSWLTSLATAWSGAAQLEPSGAKLAVASLQTVSEKGPLHPSNHR